MSTADFGRAVKAWRDRTGPEAAGLPAGGHRRAAGLRREELALLAGISVDYVTRLEQGRATSPSAQVVEALSRALRLSGAEREHLFRLAGLAPPARGTVPVHVTPSVQRLMDRLTGTPVAVFDAIWTLLTYNPMWAALMGDPSALRGDLRNVIRLHFLGTGGRVVHTQDQEAEFETAAVADLRAATASYPDDARLHRLVADLRAGSAKFAGLWDSGVVGAHTGSRKTITHPEVGPLTLDCDVLSVAGSDLRIVAYTAEPGTADADRLALLSVVGTQTLG
jgi:transcriptional regulator with XRE-family HTH domain